MSEKRSKAAKLAHLHAIATGEERFFHDYTEEIEGYLEDDDAEVRAQAVRCLWEYPDPGYIDLLMELAETDPDARVRHAAISGLGIYVYEGMVADYDFEWGEYEEMLREGELPEAEYERVRSYLLDIAKDTSRSTDARRYALEAVSFGYEEEILELIEEAYQAPTFQMKVSALFAMGRNGHRRWTPYILESLDSDSPDILYEAIRAAGELGLDSANDQLMYIANAAEDKDIRLAAIWALGQIGHQHAFELLEELTFELDEEVREVAEAALDEWLLMAELREEEAFFDEDDEEGNAMGGNGDIHRSYES